MVPSTLALRVSQAFASASILPAGYGIESGGHRLRARRAVPAARRSHQSRADSAYETRSPTAGWLHLATHPRDGCVRALAVCHRLQEPTTTAPPYKDDAARRRHPSRDRSPSGARDTAPRYDLTNIAPRADRAR